MKQKLAAFPTLCSVLLLWQSGWAQATDDQDAAWLQAEQKFKEFYQPLDPGLHYAEVRSSRLKRHLPDWRIYVRTDGHLVGRSNLFLVNRNGQVFDLGEAVWRGDAAAKTFQAQKVSEFVNGRKLEIHSAEGAVEIAKLFEEIVGAADYVGFLKINTNDFTRFDKEFLALHAAASSDRPEFRYTATESQNGWIVKVEYIGPPAMVREPPTYDIDINGDKQFVDLRWRRQ